MKQRPSSRSDAELRRWLAGASALLVALLAAACQPADLEDPESYCKPGASIVDASGKVTGCNDSGSSGGTPAGSGGSGSASCDSACFTALLTGSCNVCHSAATPMGGLDLATPGFTARLKDQPAKHQDGFPGCPTGDKLVDSANPTASWLLKKVAKQQGTCGTPMPQPLGGSDADVTCVTAYVNCIGGNP